MENSLVTNVIVDFALGVVLLSLIPVAMHFKVIPRWASVAGALASVVIIAFGVSDLKYAITPEKVTIVATYEGETVFGEVLGSTFNFVDEQDETYELTLDYFSMRSVLGDIKPSEGTQYSICYEKNTNVLISIERE